MEFSNSNSFDIFEIYKRYCDIRSEKGCGSVDVSHGVENTREALAQLLKLVDSKAGTSVRNWIFGDISKLMSRLNLLVDSCQFTCFYDFVFFMCRENGQRSITVSMAVTAWRLVLEGRFRLLSQWCDFVEKNQRHNISEDTWKQVLAFSRCVHEDLRGYDPQGAWPVLVDEFVEHMYRLVSMVYSYGLLVCDGLDQHADLLWHDLQDSPCHSRKLNLFHLREDHSPCQYDLDISEALKWFLSCRITGSRNCCSKGSDYNCIDQETQAGGSDGSLTGLNIGSGLKRKSHEDLEVELSNVSKLQHVSKLQPTYPVFILNSKRSRQVSLFGKTVSWEENPPGNATDDSMEAVKSKSLSNTSNNSPYAVEGSLSKCFAGLLSQSSHLYFDKERRVSI